MGSLRAGAVVLVRFPFSDLSSSKLRPAVVVAAAGGTDWVLSQITSKAYGDPLAVPLRAASFAEGNLPLDSFVRPSKLFTANDSIIARQVGQLSDQAHGQVVDAIVRVLQGRA